jgi:putative FmdB family regulatory protein
MPVYDYQCQDCGNEFELIFPIQEWKIEPKCPDCGGKGKRIIVVGHGGIQTDKPKWLDNSVRAQLQDFDISGTKPIETRAELAQVLKENKLQPKN